MPVNYTTEQCEEQITLWTRTIANRNMKQNLVTYANQCLATWERRLIESRERAIEINREIIESWDTHHLISVVWEYHNQYMAVAAIQLLAEDIERLSDDEFHELESWVAFWQFHNHGFNISEQVEIISAEATRREESTCTECYLDIDNCACPDDEIDNGTRQWMFI